MIFPFCVFQTCPLSCVNLTEINVKNSSDLHHIFIYTMYVNSPGAESGSYSLTFLGKKVGRHRSVAPAGKQCEFKNKVPLLMAFIHMHGENSILIFLLYLISCKNRADRGDCGQTDEVGHGLNISAAWLPPL